MNPFKNGLLTGLTLQLAVGPVFFFIINLALQKSPADGFVGVLAVTLVDYLYITLSILGIGKLLERPKVKHIFGIASSLVLIIFGGMIIQGVLTGQVAPEHIEIKTDLVGSFTSVFFLTITSPMTIVFFTSLFTAKAIEYHYTKRELTLFGIGTGCATFLFMGLAVSGFSLLRGTIPILLIQALNIIVGCLLVGYGGVRLWKSFHSN